MLKGNWQLVQQQETPQQHPYGTVQIQQGWEPEDRETIAAKIEHRAKVMRYCLIKQRNTVAIWWSRREHQSDRNQFVYRAL
jgi:hypothetical protein